MMDDVHHQPDVLFVRYEGRRAIHFPGLSCDQYPEPVDRPVDPEEEKRMEQEHGNDCPDDYDQGGTY